MYEDCVKCIVSRQSSYLEEFDAEDDDDDDDAAVADPEAIALPSNPLGYMPHLGPLSLDEEPRLPPPPSLSTTQEDLNYAGFNGRPNKVVDTCYSFWNIGALTVRVPYS